MPWCFGSVPVGASQEHPEVGVVGAGVPHLLAVDHPLVAVERRGGGQPGEVRSRRRLAEQLAPHLLAGEQRAEEPIAREVGALLQDRRAGEAGGHGRHGAAPLDLAAHDVVGPGRETPAVPPLRPRRHRPPGLDETLPPRPQRQRSVPAGGDPGPHLGLYRLRGGGVGGHVPSSFRSSPGEAGGAALADGGDPFAEVVGLLEPLLLGALVGHGGADLVGERLPQGPSDRPDRQRRRGGDLRGEVGGPAPELVARDQVIAQPDLLRRGAVDAATGVEEVEGGLLSDQARERDGEAEAGMEPELEKFAANLDSGVATRKSAARARPSPPPMAAPWTAATTGNGCSNSRMATS